MGNVLFSGSYEYIERALEEQEFLILFFFIRHDKFN